MQFEWDEDKSRKCLKKRKFDFDFAAGVFYDKNLLVKLDDRKDYGEERLLAYGKIDDILYCVVFTDKEDKIRLISARRVHRNSKEEKKYYGNS